MRKTIKIFLRIFTILIIAVGLLLVYFNLPVRNNNKNAKIGVTYSWRYAGEIGLDWQETYLAMLDDLKIRSVRIPVYWDNVEEQEGEYDFSKIDWQLDEAQKRGAEVILAVGQKVPRWPECFIPKWASEDDLKRKNALKKLIIKTVERYQNHPAVAYWQVENEPFLKFGICPTIDPNLLDQEIALVRTLDPTRKIVITDSGELSLWISAAKRADVFGTTMYRTIYKQGFGYFNYPIGPRFFHFKRWLIKTFAGQNNAVVIELQGEPWISGWTTQKPLEEQFLSMNTEKLRQNVEFAEDSGFDRVYIWGVEWWYWLAKFKNHPEMWQEAKQMINQNNNKNGT